MMSDALFSPVTVAGMTLLNRFVMAPMTRRRSPHGVPGPDVAAYYRRRVEGGVSLIITEGTIIDDPAAAADPDVPAFFGEAALAGWSEVVRGVHEAGGRIFPQLWHTGGLRLPDELGDPGVPAVSPSGLRAPGVPNGEVLTIERMDAIRTAYGDGAANAQRIGFDGIELHFASGYLVDQFFWSKTNLRDDRYGQDRYLYATEIVAECRRRVGPDFPIAVRFSQWKLQDYEARLFETPDDLRTFIARMVDAGADILHPSTRRFWQAEFAGSDLNLAAWTKRSSAKPVILVGSVGLDVDAKATIEGSAEARADVSRLELLDAMVARGDADLVAIGRALLADPAWVDKLREGRIEEATAFTRNAIATLY